MINPLVLLRCPDWTFSSVSPRFIFGSIELGVTFSELITAHLLRVHDTYLLRMVRSFHL
jgi:hypothetical protein